MIVRKAAAAWLVCIALGVAACAPRHAVRIPSPPAELRKEAAMPRAIPRGKEIEPPPPDYGKLYAEAIDRTKKAIASSRATEALPYWRRLEDSAFRTDAIYHQGVLLHIAGELDEAATSYRRALSVSPSFEPAAANLLGIYLLRGEKRKMESLTAEIFPPGSAPSREMLPELQANLASALLETGRRNEASLLFLALEASNRGAPALPWNMAVLAYRNGDRETARTISDQLPPDVATLYPVIASRFAWSQDSGAIPDAETIPAGQPRLASLSRNLAAFSEYRRGNFDAAERHLLSATGDDTAPAELISNLGLVQMELGKWKDARASLEKVTAEHPSLPEGWLNLGIFLEVYEGNPQRARECYETYVRTHGHRKKEVEAWTGWLPGPSPPSSQP